MEWRPSPAKVGTLVMSDDTLIRRNRSSRSWRKYNLILIMYLCRCIICMRVLLHARPPPSCRCAFWNEIQRMAETRSRAQDVVPAAAIEPPCRCLLSPLETALAFHCIKGGQIIHCFFRFARRLLQRFALFLLVLLVAFELPRYNNIVLLRRKSLIRG
ncbi:hypothetical protein MUK42_35958 [Musa troglodytarum]|uniref:Uncharacterized protein n=1 Tax=Musa troglodytarum TaxID=320322 RepID=A0A9E7FJQ5_9LILI|nr:hypothetical protein MUK42_35958 [Musa troglodytarum]